jgi:hypothetical protein
MWVKPAATSVPCPALLSDLPIIDSSGTWPSCGADTPQGQHTFGEPQPLLSTSQSPYDHPYFRTCLRGVEGVYVPPKSEAHAEARTLVLALYENWERLRGLTPLMTAL